VLPIIASCFFKLIWDEAVMKLEQPGLVPNFDKANEVCEQITLMSDLFAAIVSECPEAIRKDACESMLYFSQLASEKLKQHVQKKDRILLESKIYAEQIVFSCVSTLACFLDKKVYE
jgi:hypothetical protein